MSEEKQKNEDAIERRWEWFIAGFVGFCMGIPVAAWFIGHMFYARMGWWDDSVIEFLPSILQTLDCLMGLAAFLAFTGLVYLAGVAGVHKEIFEEAGKSS